MWGVRLVLFAVFVLLVAALGFFMANRQKLTGLFSNRAANLFLVVGYCLLCILLAGLPSDPDVFPSPAFFSDVAVRTGYTILGLILIGISILIWAVAVRQRKALGGEDVKAGLLTSGLYRYFRHPIYAAIVWVSLGLALVMGTWDGLLMIPALFLVNAAEAFLEERCDVGVRFAAQYGEYRKRTRMFGPLWVWATLVAVLAAVPLASQLL
jgi:protein-S-isoprenylcysteine O-methyltransferase Ste14